MENVDLDHDILVADWLRTWLREEVERDYSVTTYERYVDIAERQISPNLAGLKLQDLAPRHIRTMDHALLASGLSARTVGIAHTVLSGACRYAVRMELLERNPLHSAPPPRAKEHEVAPPAVLAVRQMLEIAQGERHRLYPFLRLLVFTGMRRGEAIGLRWCNVDLDKGYVRVVEAAVKTHHKGMIVKRPKTAKGVRTIDLDDETIQVLTRHRLRQLMDEYPGDLVFPHQDGGPLRVTTIIRDLKKLGERAGVPNITLHSLRHFHASVSLQQRQNVVVVSRRLRHASVVTTLACLWSRDGRLAEGRRGRISGSDGVRRVNALSIPAPARFLPPVPLSEPAHESSRIWSGIGEGRVMG